MANALEMALCIQQAYKYNQKDKVVSDDNFIEYIESTFVHPKKHFLDENTLIPKFEVKTEVGVDAYIELIEGDLRIGIAGSNSIKDWVLNLVHFKHSLAAKIDPSKTDLSYRIGYESVFGHISNYLSVLDRLINKQIIPSVKTISVAGHSAGARVADRVVLSLAHGYAKERGTEIPIPINLYSFGSPMFTEIFHEKRLQASHINLQRFEIEADFISHFPSIFLTKAEKRDRNQYIVTLPSVAPVFNPIKNHVLSGYIKALGKLKCFS